MFFIVVYPFIDFRLLLHRDSSRLDKPHWLMPEYGKDFIRYFGTFRERMKGRIDSWQTGGYYCSARHILTFPVLSTITLHPSFSWPKLAYRRLYYDPVFNEGGIPIIDKFRIEIGFEVSLRDTASPGTLIQGVKKLLSLPVSIKGGIREQVKADVLTAGKFLARSYLYASTKKGKEEETEKWWVAPGAPLLVIEQGINEQVELPEYTNFEDTLLPFHIKASYFKATLGKQNSISLWMLQTTADRKKNYPLLRTLRINLLRIHEEKQCLKQTLRAIKEKKIILRKGEEVSEAVQYYLNESTRFFNKQTHNGLPHKDLFTTALDYDTIVDSEKTLLYGQLSSIRKSIFKKVETMGNHPVKPGQTINEKGDIHNTSLRMIEIKDFLIRTCNSKHDFDNLCIALRMQNVYSGTDFKDIITDFVRDLERAYPDYFQKLYDALLYLKGNFKPEIDSLFALFPPVSQ